MRPMPEGRRERILNLVQRRDSWRITELADELGVSTVTVRQDVAALAGAGLLERGHGRVSRRASAAPRGGRGGPLLGMVVPAADHYCAEVVRGARDAAEAHGARLVLGISDRSPAGDLAQVNALVRAGVQGMLLTPGPPSGAPGPADEERLLDLGLPVVLVERGAVPGTRLAVLDQVGSDHAHGAGVAVRHLARLGHRRMALLAGPATPTAVQLGAGYATALASLGLAPPPPVGPGAAGFPAQVEALLAAAVRGSVTAALVHTDADAILVLRRLRARGVRVPEDLALIAYDDEIAALADVPLTAVAPPKRALGAAAVGLLLSRLRSSAPEREPRRRLELLPELRIRASCGAVDGDPGRSRGRVTIE